MTANVVATGDFQIPTLSAPSGAELAATEVYGEEYAIELVGGWELITMVGLVALHPSLQTMLGTYAAAFRTGTGWEVHMPGQGIVITCDAAMTWASMVQQPRPVSDGRVSLYQRTAGGLAAFWQGFVQSAEDQFGDGGASWVPDTPVPHDGIFTASVDLEVQGDGFGWETPEPGSGFVNLYTYLDSINSLSVAVDFGGMEHGTPVSLSLSSPSFTTQTIAFDVEFEGVSYLMALWPRVVLQTLRLWWRSRDLDRRSQ